MEVQTELNGPGYYRSEYKEASTIRVKLENGKTVSLFENGNGNLVVMSEKPPLRDILSAPTGMLKCYNTAIY